MAKAAGQDRCLECPRFLDYHRAGLPNSAEADHIIPYALGGQDEIENIKIICRQCNGEKGGKIGREKRGVKQVRRARYQPGALETALD